MTGVSEDGRMGEISCVLHGSGQAVLYVDDDAVGRDAETAAMLIGSLSSW